MDLILNQNLYRSEFKWLKKDFKKGDTLPIKDRSIPFFKIPCPVLNLTHNNKEYTLFMLEKKGIIQILYARSIDGTIIKIVDLDKPCIETILITDIEPLF